MNTDTQNTLPAQLRLAAEIIEKNLPWEHRFNETPWFTNADLAAPHILVARGHEIRLAQPTAPQPPEGFHLATDEERQYLPDGSLWLSKINPNDTWDVYANDRCRKEEFYFACPNTETPLGSDIALEPFIHPGSFDAGHADALYLVEQPTYGGPPPALVQSRKEFAAAIEAIEQPWITHDGGDNPIPGQANGMFEYKLLDNSTAKDASSDQLRWHHIGGPSDIIAYRVTKAKPPVQPAGKSILNIVQGIVSERMRFTLDVPTLHAVIEAVRAERQSEIDKLSKERNRLRDEKWEGIAALEKRAEAAEAALKKSEERVKELEPELNKLKGFYDEIVKSLGDDLVLRRISDLERQLAEATTKAHHANKGWDESTKAWAEVAAIIPQLVGPSTLQNTVVSYIRQLEQQLATLHTIPDDETLQRWMLPYPEGTLVKDILKRCFEEFLSHTQAEAKNEPKTFTGPDGKEYFPYSIGDPMPCDGYAKIEIVCIDGRTAQEDGVKYLPRTAHSNIWEKTKGWRYADTAPEEKPQVAPSSDEILQWLEERARKSRTGISFTWQPFCEGEPSGFRFMRQHFMGPVTKTLREAVTKCMMDEESPKAQINKMEASQPNK